MLIKSFLLPGVVVPAVCAAVVWAAAAWWGPRGSDSNRGGSSLAVGAAFLSAYVAITGWPRFPPVESTQRLFYWLATISVFAFVWGRFKDRTPPWPVRGAAVALLLWGMLRSPIQNTWSAAESALWLTGLLAAGLAMIRAAEKSQAVSTPRLALEAAVLRLAILGGGAVLLGLSGTARLAQLMGAVACGVVVVEALAWWRGRRPWSGADGTVLVTAFFGLLLGGYFYAELEAWPAALLIGAVMLLGFGGHRLGVLRWLPLLLLLAATALVVWSFLHQQDPYDYYGWRPPLGQGPAGEGARAPRPAALQPPIEGNTAA